MAVYSLKNLKPYLRKVKGDADRVYRAILLDLFSRVVKLTPVDTGRARANWNFAYYFPDETTTQNVSPLRKVSKLDIPAPSWPKPAYISNNLPYIQALEHGHSKRAPEGMVSVSVKAWQEKIDEIVKKEVE